ncbi:hypothetical protein AAH979_31885 [Plantactinospora sp. ZYX-F-223]|uniref:hypothetical protein n=1 Tax=Plantactinospora sp. ZYX-F-223 TaxID=3144103 RepID=UPI0031FC1FAB
MSRPTSDPRSAGKLVWASDEVIARIGQQVQPQVSLPRTIRLAATTAVVFSWFPAFVVFAVTTATAPSVTNGASVGRTAFWSLQFAILMAIAAIVATLRRRAAKPEATGTGSSAHGTALRVAIHALLTVACAWLVLALQGLSISQIATLAAMLVVVLHLLPMIVARLLQRLRRRRQASSSTPVP